MIRLEAEELFDSKVNAELESLFLKIKETSSDGITSLFYYPSSLSLLKFIPEKLKEKGYWVKPIVENHRWTKEMVKEAEDRKVYYCYNTPTDRDGTRYYRKGLKIWWKKPSFWEEFWS